tara:strand:- start:3433 stop:4557 length:1125 start_codon:yes stop_codon:yes gene_type:complete
MYGEVVERFGRFPLPAIRPLELNGRLSSEGINGALDIFAKEGSSAREITGQMVSMLYDDHQKNIDTQSIAGAILAISLFSGIPLVRVSAAVSALDTFDPDDSGISLYTIFPKRVRKELDLTPWAGEFSSNLYYLARSILSVYSRFGDNPDAISIAETALARVDNRSGDSHSSTKENIGKNDFHTPDSHLEVRALLIHGTMPINPFVSATLDEWWSPYLPGRLFEHVEKKVPRRDIYGEDDTFEWEGNYNSRTREYAAKNLRLWLNDRSQYIFDVAPHSHGNNLVFQALNQGAEIRNMLAMSCPVHTAWLPKRSQYNNIESVRVYLDLVIIADRGGQSFPKDMGVAEHYVGWFGHGKSHEPDIWDKYGISKLFQS